MKIIKEGGAVGLGLLAAGALVVLAIVVAALLGVFSADVGGVAARYSIHGRVQQKVFDPDNAVQQVAFFHDKCRDVVRDLNVIKTNQSRLTADQSAARFAKDPIRQQQAIESLTTDEQDVTGAKNIAQADAQAYNSRSAQYTANPFKDQGLPYRIDLPTSDAEI